MTKLNSFRSFIKFVSIPNEYVDDFSKNQEPLKFNLKLILIVVFEVSDIQSEFFEATLFKEVFVTDPTGISLGFQYTFITVKIT